MDNVKPKELNKLLSDEDKNEVLIDVREPFEYRSAHIAMSENIPLGKVAEAADRLKHYGSVYVTCGTGMRSREACDKLLSMGVNVVNLEGGLTAWQREGFSVIGSGKGRIPIIRQVMITAGTLVLLGVSLGFFYNEYWYGLAAFVGAGLLFAGISGYCFTSYILEKMPWNK